MIDKLKYFLSRPLQLPIVLITKHPYFRFIRGTVGYQNRANFEFWFRQKILNRGGNKKVYWPVDSTTTVHDVEKIRVGVDSAPGINGGAYITGTGGLTIGSYCIFAKNIVIITANHNLYDYRIRDVRPVYIGNYCWMGAGAKVMPGVTLGDHTIVAAGAVVTKSFPEGYCVLAGVPAKKIKELDPTQCVIYEHKEQFIGYLPKKKFEKKFAN